MKTTTSIATILAFLLLCDVLHAFSSPRSKRPLPQQRPDAHLQTKATSAAFMGVCSAALAVGLTFHPLPAQATLSQNDLENIGKLVETKMEENNLKLKTELGSKMEENNLKLKTELGSKMEENNLKLKTELGSKMEENNLKLETKLGLYPIATAGIAVVANVVGNVYSSNKLDDTLKRFDEKTEGIKAELEKNVDTKSFRAGVIGIVGGSAASAASSIFLLVLVGMIYRLTGDAWPT